MSYVDVSMFDPRLLEYIKKKQYYSKNKMTPCIPLETEYAITHNDIIKIKKYLNHEIPSQSVKLPNETREYDVYPPNIQYKNKLHYDKMEKHGVPERMRHHPKFDKVIEYADKETELPVFLSRYIHKNKSNRIYDDRNPNECINKIREQYHNGEQLDPDIMTDIMLGMPNHTRKSYGFNDPFEHYYDYIDGDVQKPEHVVLPFARGGISARLENKKQVNRDIS